MFSDRHQTEGIFTPMVWFNQNYVGRVLGKFCPALHLHLLLEPPRDFVVVFPWIFNLSLVHALWCWLSKVEKQTRPSRNRRSDSSGEITSKKCGIYALKKLITSYRCFQIWFVAKIFSQKRNHEWGKIALKCKYFKGASIIWIERHFL